MVVEIDHKRWNGVTVSPQDKSSCRVRSIKTGTNLKSTKQVINDEIIERAAYPALFCDSTRQIG